MTLYAATDVANLFIDYYSRSVDPVNLPRAQMLCYFAQAESLCRNGRPLFEDTFRAYNWGPGLTRLEFYYEGAGNMPIKVYKEYDPRIFDMEDRQLLMDVAIYYNMFSTSELQIMTYASGGPWEHVYSMGADLSDIDNSLIQEFYGRLPRIPDYKEQVKEIINTTCHTDLFSVLTKEEDSPTVVYSDNESTCSWE